MVYVRTDEALKAKMRALGIFEKDLEERFVRSSGRGGQHVNKVATCVYLCHRPTGIEVKCQIARSQALNRHEARARLIHKIEREKKRKACAERQAIEKRRRQKRKRSRKAKENMLEQKRRRSEKKKHRRYRASIEE